jgi:hypothetical protein
VVVFGGGLGVVAVADLLGQVLGQVADAAPCVLGSGERISLDTEALT